MMYTFGLVLSLGLIQGVFGQSQVTLHHDQVGAVQDGPVVPLEPWEAKYKTQADQAFSGMMSFSHMPYALCLEDKTKAYDIGIIGLPFDTATSYRPGARFGPYAIRSGSRRQRQPRGYTQFWGLNPYDYGASFIDCGDVPVTPFDNALAVDQIETAYTTLLGRPVANKGFTFTSALSKDGKEHPRIISLGGDHTIVLPILRSLYQVYGQISVIHFDAHLDSWAAIPALPGQDTEQSRVTHGTFFYLAKEEGLLSNTSIHAGIRCKLSGLEDLENDKSVGFQVITGDDLDEIGIPAIIERIRKRIGDSPVYLSLDIDVIDPGMAPATGTPEAAGWTTREVKRIIRGLAGLNFVGADIVEVAPAYDHAEVTGIVAADLVHDFLSLFMKGAEKVRPQKDEL